MENENDNIFSLIKLKDRGNNIWWLYLSQCEICKEYWLVAQEERHNDCFCLKRLDNETAIKILNDNIWPSIFDKYEYLLQIEMEAGKSVRFWDPLNSSLKYTIEDLTIEHPGIKLSWIAKLLNIDINLAKDIAKKVTINNSLKIDYNL